MVPYVTLMRLCCDVRLLAGEIPGIEPLFVETLRENEGEALLGSVAPVDAEMIQAGLVELLSAWDDPNRFPPSHRSYPGILERERRLAFCLGGLVQLASGLAVDESEPACFQKDAIILSEAVLGRERDTFEAFLLEQHRGGLQQAFAEFIRALFLRSLAEAHTMIPDMIHIHHWMDSLIYGVPKLEQRIAGFAHVFYPEPSPPNGEHQTPDHPNYYDAQDPAVRATEAIRQGQAPRLTPETLAPEHNHSTYGKALGHCLTALVRVSQAWRAGTLSKLDRSVITAQVSGRDEA